MKLVSPARLIRTILTAGVSARQINAALLLMTLMIPIAAPIPGWAYDLRLPAPLKKQVAEPNSLRSRLHFAFVDVPTEFADKIAALISSAMGKTEKENPAEIPVNERSAAIKDLGDSIRRTKGALATEDIAKDINAELAGESLSKTLASPVSLLIDDADSQAIRNSSYSPENNVGNPPGKFEADAPNEAVATRIRHRAGVANFSFDIPIAGLPGRGISASIGMTYNSRVWNRTQTGSAFTYAYNVDKNWVAPGFTIGYGSLTSHFLPRTIRMNNGDLKTYNEVVPDGYTDIDGTRHQLEPATRVRIPGTEQASDAGVNNYYYPEYATKDGTFVRVVPNELTPITPYQQPNNTNYAYATFTLVHSDGTRVTYNVPGSQFATNTYSRDHYPTTIQDSNGNQIDVGYLNGTDKIRVIEDTLGRQIKFYYENPTSADPKLIAVTVPGLAGGAERQTIRFYYEDNVPLTYQERFSGTIVAPVTGTYRALKYVYFPATQSGYRYDYHGLGMIAKITKLMGMTVSTDSTGSTGTVDSSDMAATTEYNYVSDGSSTPLTNVPKFNLRTDTWKGPSGSFLTSNTEYDSSEPPAGSTEVTTVVTVPQGNFDVKYETIADSTGYTRETSVTAIYSPLNSKVMSKTAYFWDIKPTGNFGGSYFTWLKKIEVTNDATQTRATEFEVDGYNNTTLVRECATAAPGSPCTELRRTETSYVAAAEWTNNQILRLPENVVTKVNGTAVSKTRFTYDEFAQLQETPNVVHHNDAYNPNQGTHIEWHWECNGEPSPPRCDDGTGTGTTIPALRVEVVVPNNDPHYNYRGNLTKVSSSPDATSDANAVVKTMRYDMTGNVIKASMSCCNEKTIEYDPANQYAYPTKETKGGVGAQLVTSAVYDKNTGMVVSSKDENDQITGYVYDPDTLEQTRVNYPNGAWAESEINNTQFPYFVKSTSSLDSTRSVSSWNFFDGAGRGFRNRSLTANGYLSTDVEFDSAGRVKKTYNPYTVAALDTVRPGDIKFTEVTGLDGLGRVLETTLPDASKVNASFDGNVATMTDQAGKKRRQIIDDLGRIKEVHEPVDAPPDGNPLGPVGTPHQPTVYDYDGNDNLTKVTQSVPGGVSQVREFVYDSLSRLTRERQVEALPKLDADGNHGSQSSTKWTGVYKYTSDGSLDYGVDARGVKTDFDYDPLNRIEKVEYSGDPGYTTPTVEYTYDEARTDPVLGTFYNKGRLTTVMTQQVSVTGGQFTPKTIQKYDYDKVGQVVNHHQTIDQQNYTLQYGYNLAGQLTSEKYPSGRVVNMTVDNYGVTQTIADSQRTYLNGITATYDANGMTSQVTLGNGTTETFRLNERSQMTSQSLKRATEVLQKFDYAYGQTNAAGEITPGSNNGQLAKIEAFIGAAKQRTQKFSYDSVGRLSKSEEYRGDTNALTYKQVFDFDRFGNLYRKAGSNPASGQQNPIPFIPIEEATTPGTGDIDKATNRFRSGTTYDDTGNVTTDNKFRSTGFAYDANGRVVKATKANAPDAHTVYDALGNRVATKINDVWQYMIYDAFGQLVAEYGALADGMGGVKYVQQDHQGSVRTVTNSNGFVISRTDHQAFGEKIGSGVGLRTAEQRYGSDSSTRQGYGLTENDDATGQQQTWFRKLETQAGRWSSPDPYIGSMSVRDPQSFNRYSYVENDPITFIDPSGLLRLTPAGCTPVYSSDGNFAYYSCTEVFPGQFAGLPPRDPRGLGPGTPQTGDDEMVHCDPKVDAQIGSMLAKDLGSRRGGVNTDTADEHAFIVYEDAQGLQVTPIVKGSRDSVSVPWPVGAIRVIAFIHSHGGIRSDDFAGLRPSANDITNANTLGIIYYAYVAPGKNGMLYNPKNPKELNKKNGKPKKNDRVVPAKCPKKK